MSPLAYHILAATGIEPAEPSTEPPATRGDWLVAVFCLGVALGWIVGAV